MCVGGQNVRKIAVAGGSTGYIALTTPCSIMDNIVLYILSMVQ